MEVEILIEYAERIERRFYLAAGIRQTTKIKELC